MLISLLNDKSVIDKSSVIFISCNCCEKLISLSLPNRRIALYRIDSCIVKSSMSFPLSIEQFNSVKFSFLYALSKNNKLSNFDKLV